MRTGYFYLIIALLLLFSACKEDPTDPGGGSTEDVNNYLNGLPAWSQFSPPESDLAPTPVGDPINLDNDTLDVETVDDSGEGRYFAGCCIQLSIATIYHARQSTANRDV